MKNHSFNFFSLLLIGITFLISCKERITQPDPTEPPDNSHKVTIAQGVWGNVWFWEGNFMPPVEPKSASITPVVRDVYVFEATDHNETQPVSGGAFFSAINSELITIVRSDADGFFQVNLDPGKYSFFVMEDSLFYANEWDNEGYILSATVLQGEVTKRQIDITYKAYF